MGLHLVVTLHSFGVGRRGMAAAAFALRVAGCISLRTWLLIDGSVSALGGILGRLV